MADEDSYDYSFKTLVIGESGVGKTNLLGRFVHDRFEFSSRSTIGLELSLKIMKIKGKTVKVQVWDTAGQERYRSITNRYYRGAVGALLVYDITSRKSFEEVHRWLKELKNEAHPESVVMLIGNKSDLEDKREISCEEAMRFAVKNDLMFMETSALSNVNVEEAFNALVTNIFDKLATKLVTMDDKRAELLKGQTITLTPNEPNTTNYSSSSSSSCAC